MEQHISTLNWFDITIISIVAISTIFALLRGFIKAFFSLITWIASGAVAVSLYPFLFPYFSTKIHSEKLAVAVSFFIGFLVVFIILAIINSRIIYSLRKVTGGVFDRLLGLAFGGARGILIVCLIFFSISLTSKMLHLGSNPERPGPSWFAKASSYETLDMATNRIISFSPEDMPKKLEETVNKFKDITVAAMGDELEASPGAAKTLSDTQRQLMKKVIAALPKEDLAEVYKKNDGDTTALSEFEKIEIFREILAKYKGYEVDGKISADKIISESEFNDLENALKVEKPENTTAAPEEKSDSGEVGYKDHNIKQLDRLIDGVK